MHYQGEQAHEYRPCRLAHPEGDFQYPLLELSLDASNFKTADWESLQSTVQHSPAYSSLQSLTLRYGNIDCFWSCRWLGKFQRLVHLDVQGAFNSPQTRFYHLKDDCPNLTILDISYTGIHHFSISEVPNLNVLNMAGVCFSLHPSLARDILTLRHLVSLDISHSNLLRTSMCSSNEQRDPETIKILSTLVNLKCLDVSGCHVTSNDMELFDPPHHRMRFMGLLGTHACTKAQINSDVVCVKVCVCVCVCVCRCVYASSFLQHVHVCAFVVYHTSIGCESTELLTF